MVDAAGLADITFSVYEFIHLVNIFVEKICRKKHTLIIGRLRTGNAVAFPKDRGNKIYFLCKASFAGLEVIRLEIYPKIALTPGKWLVD
jgi:hypothetical protein